MHPVERYLTELLHLHRLQAGTGELSAYPPLFALLTEIGRELKPRLSKQIAADRRAKWVNGQNIGKSEAELIACGMKPTRTIRLKNNKDAR